MEKIPSIFDDPHIEYTITNGRGLSDILIKMLAVHSATTIAVGHLTTLRGLSPPHQRLTLIAFWLCPMFPLAELVVDVARSISAAWASGGDRRPAYYLAACLGMRAASSNGRAEQVLELLQVDPDARLLSRKTLPRDTLWAARMGVLIAFVAQDLSIIILYVRRTEHVFHMPVWFKPEYVTCDAVFDNVDFQFALGGFVAGLISLVVSACNWTWTYHPIGARDHLPQALEPFSGTLDSWFDPNYHLPPQLLVAWAVTLPTLWRSLLLRGHPATDIHSPDFGKSKGALSIVLIEQLLISTFWFAVRFLPPNWRRRLLIGPLMELVTFSAAGGLTMLRILTVSRVWRDLLLVRACRLGESRCAPALLWRDPREGLLWAF